MARKAESAMAELVYGAKSRKKAQLARHSQKNDSRKGARQEEEKPIDFSVLAHKKPKAAKKQQNCQNNKKTIKTHSCQVRFYYQVIFEKREKRIRHLDPIFLN